MLELLGITVAAAVVVLAIVRIARRRAPDTVASISRENAISSTPAGQLLRTYVESMSQTGIDAEAKHQSILQRLVETPLPLLAEIAGALERVPPSDYALRWALVYTAAQLGVPAVDLLRQIAMAPIPAETSPNPHGYSTVAQETIIRTRAVAGLERLAKEGIIEARTALLDSLTQPSLSIRAAAAQALMMELPDSTELRSTIASKLPEDQRFVVDLKRVDVRMVSQIREPAHYLASLVRSAHIRPPDPTQIIETPLRQRASRSAPTIK